MVHESTKSPSSSSAFQRTPNICLGIEHSPHSQKKKNQGETEKHMGATEKQSRSNVALAT